MGSDESDRQLFERARAAWEREDWLEAAEAYEALLAEHPDEDVSPAWWFDAALAYKFLRDWPKAYELGKQAAARSPRGEQDPAFWNLGIAATVLHDWPTARDAWDGFGIEIEPSEGEIVTDFGIACVRIKTAEGREVVWVRRICPTRGRVLNVPFATDRRLGEIVLHDGAPNGERMIGERRHPVFDEIMLWRPSDIPTMAATVDTATPQDLVDLEEVFVDRGYGVERVDSAQLLCKCCSEGSVETGHLELGPGSRRVLLGVPEDQVRVLLELWVSGNPDTRAWRDLHLLN
jgi:hypothetical protein